MHLLKQLNAALVFFLEIAMITGLGSVDIVLEQIR